MAKKRWQSVQLAAGKAAGRSSQTNNFSWWFGWKPLINGDRLNTSNRWQKLGLDAKKKVIKVDSDSRHQSQSNFQWPASSLGDCQLERERHGEGVFRVSSVGPKWRKILWNTVDRVNPSSAKTEWGNKSSVASVYSWTILTNIVTKLK